VRGHDGWWQIDDELTHFTSKPLQKFRVWNCLSVSLVEPFLSQEVQSIQFSEPSLRVASLHLAPSAEQPPGRTVADFCLSQ